MSDQSKPSITVAIAGTTARTVLCAEALSADDRYEITWVLTPQPRPIGRKQVITPNPLHTWAQTHEIETVLLDTKIDDSIKDVLTNKYPAPDILLVVDFGYIVPNWLLRLPQYGPLNIHPSQLPRWRGSSPGQFVLLYGEKNSAVTLMKMNSELDQGDIIAQVPVNVSKSWSSSDYYHHAFIAIQEKLADLIADFVNGDIQPKAQPLESPTIQARRLEREDGFIEYSTLKAALSEETVTHSLNDYPLNLLLEEAAPAHPHLPSLVDAACKALNPWPGLWTTVETDKGTQRLKILQTLIETAPTPHLMIQQAQLEGKQPMTWEQVSNYFKK